MPAELGLTLTGTKCLKGDERPYNGPRFMQNILLLMSNGKNPSIAVNTSSAVR